jgi:hypothetical protein
MMMMMLMMLMMLMMMVMVMMSIMSMMSIMMMMMMMGDDDDDDVAASSFRSFLPKHLHNVRSRYRDPPRRPMTPDEYYEEQQRKVAVQHAPPKRAHKPGISFPKVGRGGG